MLVAGLKMTRFMRRPLVDALSFWSKRKGNVLQFVHAVSTNRRRSGVTSITGIWILAGSNVPNIQPVLERRHIKASLG